MLSEFACYYPAETPVFISISIESDTWTVAKLLKEIQMELKSFGRDVSLANLRLFKVNLFFLLQTAD